MNAEVADEPDQTKSTMAITLMLFSKGAKNGEPDIWGRIRP
jgi:hypothetical protein